MANWSRLCRRSASPEARTRAGCQTKPSTQCSDSATSNNRPSRSSTIHQVFHAPPTYERILTHGLASLPGRDEDFADLVCVGKTFGTGSVERVRSSSKAASIALRATLRTAWQQDSPALVPDSPDSPGQLGEKALWEVLRGAPRAPAATYLLGLTMLQNQRPYEGRRMIDRRTSCGTGSTIV